ncbi:hypothetical protein [Burkholderia vietnamiensis]|uniref:hypothetical protein n=1 Tax=Burkholderia vietnamiensis TaxID=60552 RepID=UPI001589AF19|nr:hypothetical protein [Burkholderia vietnamiensis]
MKLTRYLAATAAAALLTFSALTATAAPQPDLSISPDRYEMLQSGNQLMFQYYALSGVPVDYQSAARYMSEEYRQTSDTFRQQDLLKGLRPRIDAALAHAKANHYFRMDIDMTGSSKLSAYDFKNKGFYVDDVFDEGAFRYFGDNQHYRLEFTNSTRYKFLPVPNEGVARTIESIRSKHESLTLRIYLFANEVNGFNEQTKSVITRVALLGQGGQVLTSYAGPLKAEPQKKSGGQIMNGWF